MLRRFLDVLIVLGVAFGPVASRALDLTCASGAANMFVPTASEGGANVSALQSGWVEIREEGAVLDTQAGSAEAFAIPQPLRFGSHWVDAAPGRRITVRSADGAPPHDARIILHCDMSALDLRRLNWLRRLSGPAGLASGPIAAAQLAGVQLDLEALRNAAPDAESTALATHLLALAHTQAGNFFASAEAFAQAERLWIDAGDVSRAEAAHVGRIDALYGADALEAVRAETENVSSDAVRLSYFDARALNDRCLTFEDHGDFDRAEACYGKTLRALEALGETAEYASTLRNLANLQRKRGRFDESARMAAEALQMATGPFAPMTRGRSHLLLATLARQRGDLARSLREINAGDVELQGAGGGALFWRGMSRLEEAQLFEQLGAYYEAYGALAEASASLAPQDSLALRSRIFADLEADTGSIPSAAVWYTIAEHVYSQSGMLPAAEVTQLARLRLEVGRNDLREGELATAQKHVVPAYAAQWQLLSAEIQLKQNRLERARRLLDTVEATSASLPLRDRVRLEELRSDYWTKAGNPARALERLFDAITRTRDYANATRNPILRLMIERLAVSPRRRALGLVLDSTDRAEAARDAAAIATRLLPLSPPAVPIRNTDAMRNVEFDRAVAAELLGSDMPQGGKSAQRSLLTILGRESEAVGQEKVSALDTEALQRALPSGSAFIAYIDAGSRGALLWVARDGIAVFGTAAPEEVRRCKERLRDLLRSPTASVSDIAAAAADLSSGIFRKAPGPLPARLFVSDEPPLDDIPWAVLCWPGSECTSLVQTTTISLVHADQENLAATTGAAVLHVVSAAQDQSSGGLAPLAGAAAEGELIADVVGARQRVDVDAHPTRQSILHALADPNAWIHVAAHGSAQPQRFGSSGIWLEPTPPDPAPQFLSWVDVLDAGARADLIVLNACRLADGGNVAGTNLSFAGALVRAGARRVVAAMWPLSDSAAALWVPAFYSAIGGDPQHDAAAALRAAQLRLRDSREFRHPYFWASLQTYERLPISASTRVLH